MGLSEAELQLYNDLAAVKLDSDEESGAADLFALFSLFHNGCYLLFRPALETEIRV